MSKQKVRRDSKLRPLWRCPKYGHRFASRNLWHSCTHYTLDHHFQRCDPIVRKTFARFLAAVRRNRPVTVIAQKTRIVLMVRVRFAGGYARKNWFLTAMWLKRRAAHPRLLRLIPLGPRDFSRQFRLEKPSDVDARLAALPRESYAIGCQKHLA
jgi:hypothetical protein